MSSMQSVLNKFPIVNKSWASLDRVPPSRDMLLRDAMEFNRDINRYFKEATLLNGEVFYSRLSNTRTGFQEYTGKNDIHLELIIGHAYDPWWRSITEYKEKHYSSLEEVKIFRRSDIIRQEDNIVLVWILGTTIDKVPIFLLLYDFIKVDLAVSNARQNEHIDSIHPYIEQRYDI